MKEEKVSGLLDQTKRAEESEYNLCILLSANTLYILQEISVSYAGWH
jgi:hypothetical protein